MDKTKTIERTILRETSGLNKIYTVNLRDGSEAERFFGLPKKSNERSDLFQALERWKCLHPKTSPNAMGNSYLVHFKGFAFDIYKRNFWEKLKCDYIPDPIAAELFDFTVTDGTKAASVLQKLVGCNPTGAINTNCIMAIRAKYVDEPELLLEAYQNKRAKMHDNATADYVARALCKDKYHLRIISDDYI